MKQTSLGVSGFEISSQASRKPAFLNEHRDALGRTRRAYSVASAAGKTARPPFGVGVLLRIYFMQYLLQNPAHLQKQTQLLYQWFGRIFQRHFAGYV